ncbi:hypothetical protein LINGRAHAP2_LOCUS13579, partial [Linum grandiflorum]
VESRHSSLKSWLNTSTHHVDPLFKKYHTSIGGQVIEVQKNMDESRANVFSYCYNQL